MITICSCRFLPAHSKAVSSCLHGGNYYLFQINGALWLRIPAVALDSFFINNGFHRIIILLAANRIFVYILRNVAVSNLCDLLIAAVFLGTALNAIGIGRCVLLPFQLHAAAGLRLYINHGGGSDRLARRCSAITAPASFVIHLVQCLNLIIIGLFFLQIGINIICFAIFDCCNRLILALFRSASLNLISICIVYFFPLNPQRRAVCRADARNGRLADRPSRLNF